jgi:NAD-dependent epimerase/dehydratase family protein
MPGAKTGKEHRVRDRILVTGATGLLGRLVVKRLHDKADEVRIMSRKAQTSSGNGRYTWASADLRSGHRVPDAVADINVIVHCATAYGRGGTVALRDRPTQAGRSCAPRSHSASLGCRVCHGSPWVPRRLFYCFGSWRGRPSP